MRVLFLLLFVVCSVHAQTYYPSGICGINMLCGTNGTSVYTDMGPTKCNSDQFCREVDPWATCGQVGTNAFCRCSNPCRRGPKCTLLAGNRQTPPALASARVPGVCYTDDFATIEPCGRGNGNTRCASGCVRQTPSYSSFPRTTTPLLFGAGNYSEFLNRTFVNNTVVNVVHDPADVCCDRGFGGNECNVRLTTEPTWIADKRVFNDSVGPGVCNVTIPCDARGTPIGLCLTPAVSVPVSAYTCSLSDPGAKCRLGGGCVCSSPCFSGPLCTIPVQPVVFQPNYRRYDWWVKRERIERDTRRTPLGTRAATAEEITTHRLSATASGDRVYAIIPEGWYSVSYMFFQNYTDVTNTMDPKTCYTITTRQPKQCAAASCPEGRVCTRSFGSTGDLCCPRGFSGPNCTTPVGCTLGGCMNGGRCNNATDVKPEFTKCHLCPIATNVTGSKGYIGDWCEKENVSTLMRYSLPNGTANATPQRRLLAFVEGPKIYTGDGAQGRWCDCGVRWLPVTQSTAVHEVVPLLYTGNYANMDDLSTLLLTTISPFTNPSRAPAVLRRRVLSVEEARYLCHADAYCDGFFHYDASYVSFFSNSSRSGRLIRELASGDVEVHAIERTSKRESCNTMRLDVGYYDSQYSGIIGREVFGKAISGRVWVNQTERAEVHWRLFGHLQYLSPVPNTDCRVPWDETRMTCTIEVPLAPGYAASATEGYYDTQAAHFQRNESCVNGRIRNTTVYNWVNTTITYTSIFAPYNVLRVESVPPKNRTTALVVETTTPCDASTQLQSATGTITDSKAGFVYNMSQCGEARWSDPDLFATPPPPTLLMGSIEHNIYKQPFCACKVPFRANLNHTNCADSMCGIMGKVNTSWVLEGHTRPAPEACICNKDFMTPTGACNDVECDWCRISTAKCTQARGGQVDQRTGKCACTDPQWTSPPGTDVVPCSVPTCNPANTAEVVNATKACICKAGFHPPTCDIHCVNGNLSEDGKCICNKRKGGYKGDACDIPLCGTDGRSTDAMFDKTDPRHNTTTPDEELVQCDCLKPWVGQFCDRHTCNDAPVYSQSRLWYARAEEGFPFGKAVQGANAGWTCECRWPFMLDSRGTCTQVDCGFGTPYANMTTDTPPRERCTCPDTATLNVETNPKDCTNTSCASPCMSGSCGLDAGLLSQFKLQRICRMNTTQALGCVCGAALAMGDACQASCKYKPPCITHSKENPTNQIATPIPGTNQFNCTCHAWWGPGPGKDSSTDCSVFTPPAEQVPPSTKPAPINDTAMPSTTTVLEGGSSSSSSSIFESPVLLGAVASVLGAVLAARGYQEYAKMAAKEKPYKGDEETNKLLPQTQGRARLRARAHGANASSK